MNAVWPESWIILPGCRAGCRPGPKVFQNAVVKLADVYGVRALVEEVNKESVEYVQIMCLDMFSHK